MRTFVGCYKRPNSYFVEHCAFLAPSYEEARNILYYKLEELYGGFNDDYRPRVVELYEGVLLTNEWRMVDKKNELFEV